jgi:hypothetical protein
MYFRKDLKLNEYRQYMRELHIRRAKVFIGGLVIGCFFGSLVGWLSTSMYWYNVIVK